MNQETQGCTEEQERRRLKIEEELATRAMILALARDSGIEGLLEDFDFEEFIPRGRELLALPTHRKVEDVMGPNRGSKRARQEVLAGLGLLAQALDLVSNLRSDQNLYAAPPILGSLVRVEKSITDLIVDLGNVVFHGDSGGWDLDLRDAKKTGREESMVEIHFAAEEEADREEDACEPEASLGVVR